MVKNELKLENSNDAIISNEATRKKEIIKLLNSPRVRNMLKQDYGRKEFVKSIIEFRIENAERYYNDVKELLE